MVSADRGPTSVADYCALDATRVVPIPGLTGSPSRLVVLAIGGRVGFFRAIGSSCDPLCRRLGGAVNVITGHDGPGDPRRLAGHGDSDQRGRHSSRQAGSPGSIGDGDCLAEFNGLTLRNLEFLNCTRSENHTMGGPTELEISQLLTFFDACIRLNIVCDDTR